MQLQHTGEMTMSETTRASGRIIKVSREGWGFISSRDIEFTRIFFHWTALKQNTLKFKELKTGMIVEFTPVETPEKGYRAIHIIVTDTRVKEKNNEPEPESSTEGIPDAEVSLVYESGQEPTRTSDD
jgi:cold shock CspA family protein